MGATIGGKLVVTPLRDDTRGSAAIVIRGWAPSDWQPPSSSAHQVARPKPLLTSFCCAVACVLTGNVMLCVPGGPQKEVQIIAGASGGRAAVQRAARQIRAGQCARQWAPRPARTLVLVGWSCHRTRHRPSARYTAAGAGGTPSTPVRPPLPPLPLPRFWWCSMLHIAGAVTAS